MIKTHVRLLSAAASLLLAGAFIYAMFQFFLPRQAPPFLLPSPAQAVDPGESGLPYMHGERRTPITVNRENILTVLRTIASPRIFSAEWVITYSWTGGESSVRRQVYANGDVTKIEWSCGAGEIQRYVLTGAERTFIWFPGDEVFLEFAGDDPDGQNGLAGYEPLKFIESERVLAAGYIVEEGLGDDWQSVLWLTIDDPELGVTATYRIALDTGFLLSAEIRGDSGSGVSLYAVRITEGHPDDERFRLPDGRLVWEIVSVG